MYKRLNISDETIGKTIVALLSLCGLIYIFGRTVWKPNEYMYAFGGDPYLIYYNIAYHVKYGTGYYMSNMAYPLEENPFMSGGEGAWALLLLGLKNLGIDLSGHVIGFVHVTKFLAIWVAAHFTYKSLRLLEVTMWIAAIFAVLVVFLNPIMLRMFSHYGLAYPLLIPMAIWWVIYRHKNHAMGWVDAGMFLALTFFSFNNPYVGFSATAFALLSALFLWWFSDGKPAKRSMMGVFAVSLLSVVMVYVVLKATDPFSDRVEQQWGFFHYFASPAGFIAPQGSLMNTLLNKAGLVVNAGEFERKQYLGIAVLLILFLYVGGVVFKLLVKDRTVSNSMPVFFKAVLLSALCLFIFAANKKLIPLNEVWVEDHLGSLLMFKAVARLAWPVYFVLSIFAVYLLSQWANSKGKTIVITACLALASIWIIDIGTYIKPNFLGIYNPNFWSSAEEQKFQNEMEAAGVDLDNYQAILSVPKLELWSDKFLSKEHWATEFHSFRLSVFSGLPLINAMMSRAAVGVTTSSIQFFSDPVIQKQRIKLFPNEKPILLVLGDDYPNLYRGEAGLLSKAELVYKTAGYSLFELPLSALDNEQAIAAANTFRTSEAKRPPLYHMGFNTEGNEKQTFFFSAPALILPAGSHKVLSTTMPVEAPCQLRFSVWTHIDHHKYGIGEWVIQTIDGQNNVISHIPIATRDGYEIQDDWVRTETLLDYAPGYLIEAHLISNQDFIIDDIIIDYSTTNSVVDSIQYPSFLYNGFKVPVK